MATVQEPSAGIASTGRPPLSLSSRCDANQYRIIASGELDLMTAPILDQALRQANYSNRPTVIIDLARMSFCDCAGMRVLTTHHQALNDAGRLLLISHPSRSVSRLAAVTGLDQVLHLCRAHDAAPDTHTENTP